MSNMKWIARDTTSGSIHITADWKNKELKKFRAKKKTKNYDGDSLISEKIELDGIVQFMITDSANNAYNMEYRILKNLRDTSKDMKLPLESLDLCEDSLVLRYTTDGRGVFNGYKNRVPIENKMDNLMKLIIENSTEKSKKLDAGEKKVSEAILSKLGTGKLLFSNIFDVYVSNFHNLHGYASGLNDTLSYTESIPGVWSDKPITFDCYLYVTSVDTVNNEIRLDIEKYADLEDYIKEYADFLEKASIENNAKPQNGLKEELEKLNMRMEAYLTYYIDLRTGWPNFISAIKSVIVQDPKTRQEKTKEEIWTLNDLLTDG